MPTASIDFAFAAFATIMVVMGTICGVNMLAEPYLDGGGDGNGRYYQIGNWMLLSEGFPSDWGAGNPPTNLGFASAGDIYELDIDKVTLINPSNEYCVDYSVLWQALGMDDVSFNIQAEPLFDLSLTQASSQSQGNNTVYGFTATTTGGGYPLPAQVSFYVVIRDSIYSASGTTDDRGTGAVNFTLPNSLNGTALLVGIARTAESILSYSVLPFAHLSGAPAPKGDYATLSPLDYTLNTSLSPDATVVKAAFLSFDSFTSEVGWIYGWEKRVKITIDHGDFDENVTDFPVLIHLSNSSGWDADDVSFVFDELQDDSNRGKIAVTGEDGVSQLYVEVERWDDANEEAWLWVRVPEVSSIVDTVLYLYYDRDQPENNVYVGDPDSAPAESVWDDSFELVTHMRDDPDASHVRDSSAEGNDGVKHAANEPVGAASGQFDGAQSFDGLNDDIDMGDVASDNWTEITVEAWTYHDALGEDRVVCKATGTAVANHIFSLGVPGNSLRVRLSTDGAGGGTSSHDSNGGVHGTGRWEHVAFTWGSSDATIWFYINGGVQGNATRDGDTITDSAQAVAVGNVYPGASEASSRNFDGIIDEVRISSRARSAAWVRASYKTGIDDMLDFEGEETRAGYFQDIWSSDLASNLDRWESFVQEGYRFGKSSPNATAESQSPYSEGIWIDWGTNGDGTTSAATGVTMNVSGRGAEVDLYYTVNATTRILVSGSYVDLGGDAKAVTVHLQVQVDGSQALYGSKTAEVLRFGSWQNMASFSDYAEKDYGNGTYTYRFTGDLPGVQVPVRFQVYDRRGLLVVAEAGIQEG